MRASLLTLTICLIAIPAQAQYSGGTGEPNDPYQIATADDLMLLGDSPEDYDKHFILTADIDLDPNLPGRKVFDKAVIAPDTNDVADGFQGAPITGIFDGNGHVIRNLHIQGTDYLGLFGQIGFPASVFGLGIEAVEVSGTEYAGSLAGWNYGIISVSYSRGAVNANEAVGGLVGYNADFDWGGWNSGSIINSYSISVVSGKGEYVSGLAGSYCGYISACFWESDASGQFGGFSTMEMQTAKTFLDAGWDFVDETANGSEDIWKISESLDYPRLWWEEFDGRVSLELGQMLTVTLDSNPSTGYRWEWVENQGSILEQIGEAEFKPSETGEPPLVGAGGWEIFRFTAVSAGQMTLRLVYRRPWEEGVEPLKTFSLQVVVPYARGIWSNLLRILVRLPVSIALATIFLLGIPHAVYQCTAYPRLRWEIRVCTIHADSIQCRRWNEF